MSRILDPINGIHTAIKSKGYSPMTEKTYAQWAERFLDYHEDKHPEALATIDIPSFLKHLAVDCKVSAATQHQALTALIFLYEHVLDKDLKGDRHALLKSLPPRIRRKRRK